MRNLELLRRGKDCLDKIENYNDPMTRNFRYFNSQAVICSELKTFDEMKIWADMALGVASKIHGNCSAQVRSAYQNLMVYYGDF